MPRDVSGNGRSVAELRRVAELDQELAELAKRCLESLSAGHKVWLLASQLPKTLGLEARDRDIVDGLKQA